MRRALFGISLATLGIVGLMICLNWLIPQNSEVLKGIVKTVFAAFEAVVLTLAINVKVIKKLEGFFTKHERGVVWASIVLAGVCYVFITNNMHQHFKTTAYDLGLYDRLALEYGRFHFIYWEKIVGMVKLADHFSPIVAVPGFLYFIHKSVYWLLIFEAIVTTLGFLPIYWFAKKVLKSPMIGFLVGFGYLFSQGVLSAIAFPAHPGTWLATIYGFILWFAYNKKWGWYYFMIALALLTKENSAIDLFLISLVVGFWWKNWKHALVTFGVGVVGYFVLIKWLMVGLNGGLPYKHGVFVSISNNPLKFLGFIIGHPIKALGIILENTKKITTLGFSLLSTGGVAIFSPIFWLIALPSLFLRLLSNNPGMTSLNYHYSIVYFMMLSISVIFSIDYLKKKKLKLGSVTLALLVFFIFILMPWAYRTPLANKVKLSEANRELLRIVNFDAIPKRASVITENGIEPHLNYREKRGVLGENKISDFEYVLLSKDRTVDSWPLRTAGVKDLILKLRVDMNYEVYLEGQSFVIFKKK